MAPCRRKTCVESLWASPFGLWSVVLRVCHVVLLSLDGINAGLPQVALLFLLLIRHTHDTIKPSPNLGALA